MALSIAAAEPADLPALMRLMRYLADEHALLDPFFVPSDEWHDSIRRMFLERFGVRDHCLLLARDGGEPVGMVTAVLRRAPAFVVERRAVIENLVVAPAHRRQGVGRALVEAVADWCRRRGTQGMELAVAEGNQAGRAFWSALGYRPVILRLYRRIDGAGR